MQKAICVCLFSLMVAAPVWAGTTTAKIQKILIWEASGLGLVYIYPVGGVANPPACHGANGDYYSFAMNRPFAKEYLALLTGAHLSGATVALRGKNACLDQPFSETLEYLTVMQP